MVVLCGPSVQGCAPCPGPCHIMTWTMSQLPFSLTWSVFCFLFFFFIEFTIYLNTFSTWTMSQLFSLMWSVIFFLFLYWIHHLFIYFFREKITQTWTYNFANVDYWYSGYGMQCKHPKGWPWYKLGECLKTNYISGTIHIK